MHKATPGQRFCYLHSPENAAARHAAAVKAGKTRQGGELAELKRELRVLMHDVLDGGAETGRASVAAQVGGVLLRCLELEHKRRIADEFDERLSQLEKQRGLR